MSSRDMYQLSIYSKERHLGSGFKTEQYYERTFLLLLKVKGAALRLCFQNACRDPIVFTFVLYYGVQQLILTKTECLTLCRQCRLQNVKRGLASQQPKSTTDCNLS